MYFQLFGFSPDDRTIKVWLAQSVLQAAATRTSAVARREVRARTAHIWRGARFQKWRSIYDLRTE